jgi:hypothetical protein
MGQTLTWSFAMHATPHPVSPFSTTWRSHARLFFMSFMLVALMEPAQAAPDLIASSTPLPLRNVLIEVRQVQQTQAQNSDTQVRGSVGVGVGVDAGSGAWGQGQIQARQGQSQRSGTATQQVLVLNGRSARVAVATQVPLRVLQTYVRNGAVVAVAGTLILEAGTGFSATPRWDGSDRVELEISAAQTLQGGQTLRGDAPNALQSAHTSSLLVVPLDTWVTVAESDTQSGGSGSSLGGQGQWAEQGSSALQVRLTLR